MMQDLKGLHDIRVLMQRPEEEIHCSELIGSSIAVEQGIELIDQKAKEDYQQKILNLQEDIAEAENMNKVGEVSKLQEEYDTLLEHLTSSLGIDGKARKTSSSIDKARSAVTWRIRSSIKKLQEVHPSLGKHLSASVKTGTFCAYRPDKVVEWEM